MLKNHLAGRLAHAPGFSPAAGGLRRDVVKVQVIAVSATLVELNIRSIVAWIRIKCVRGEEHIQAAGHLPQELIDVALLARFNPPADTSIRFRG